MDEQALLDKALAGEREALGQLLVRHQQPCFALAWHLTGNAADAEDVCQDALVRATRDVASYRGQGTFRSWLLSLVVHAHADRVDAERARRKREEKQAMQHGGSSAPSDAQRLELKQSLEFALSALEQRYRIPIVLHYQQGLSYAEAAAVLAIPEGTLATNIRRGLEELRGLMERAGYSCVTPALIVTLEQAGAISAPASLTTFIHSLNSGAVAAKGAADAALTFSWKIAAAVSLAAVAGIGGLTFFRSVPAAAPLTGDTAPAAEVEVPPSAAEADPVRITPSSYDAWLAFGELADKGGPRVAVLGGRRPLSVPAALRFTAVDGHKLIEAVASSRELKVAWVRGGKWAVLYAGASEQDLARATQGLAAADPLLRQDAAWEAGWLNDVRIVPLLVKAAKDADAEVAREARLALRRASWKAVLALDASAIDLLAQELDCRKLRVCEQAFEALKCTNDPKALTLLQKTISDSNPVIRINAVAALSGVHGPGALELLGVAQADPDASIRLQAAQALSRHSDLRAVGLLEKLLADADVNVRSVAIAALGRYSGEQAPAVLARALVQGDRYVRAAAAHALGRPGDESVLTLLRQALDDDDGKVSGAAAEALGRVGGDKALALLENFLAAAAGRVSRAAAVSALGAFDDVKAVALAETALLDTDPKVRDSAAAALQSARGPKWLNLLEKAVAHADYNVRSKAAYALGNVGGERALTLLEKPLGDRHESVRLTAVQALENIGGDKALSLLEKAWSDPDPRVRASATGMFNVTGEQALAQVEKALASQDASLHCSVLYELSKFRGERILPLIE